MSQEWNVRRRKLVLWLSLFYAVTVAACLVRSYLKESSTVHSQGRRPPLVVALLGRDSLNHGTMAYRDEDLERSAAFARAGAVLVTTLYVLGVGSLVGPQALRLVSGNLLVLVLILLGCEGATRILGLHFPAIALRGSSDRNLWTYDRTKGWFHVPLGTGQVPISGPDRGRVRINSLGLRGREDPRQKPEGFKRVVVLGDSFVFGLGVDEENIFTTHLEKFLNARSSGGRHEVINMGLTGYSTDQESILLEELGLSLFPDVVVLVVCDNDFLANTEDFVYRRYYKPFFELDDQGHLLLRNSPVPLLSRWQRIKLFLGQELNVWNFIRSRKSGHPAVAGFVNFFQVAVPRRPTVDPVEITAALILSMAERVDAAGARFLVINTGHRGEKTPLFHRLRPKLRKPGIHLLGLEEVLGNARREAPEKYWDFPRDTHWNRDAHQLAAEVICNFILWNRLLP